MSTAFADVLERANIPTEDTGEPLRLGTTLTGLSGKQYSIAQMFQEREHPMLAVIKEFTSDNLRKPFSMWDGVDESFRNVVARMASLDPKRRITAK